MQIENFKVFADLVETKSFSKFKDFNEKKVVVSLRNKNKVVDSYRKLITVEAIDDNSSVLILNINYPNRGKAMIVLDELINQYNIDAIKDKNEVSQKTINFIKKKKTVKKNNKRTSKNK